MRVKRGLIRNIVYLTCFYVVVLMVIIIGYLCTRVSYKQITFQIQDYKYASDTGTGYEMTGEDGKTYVVAADRQPGFAAADFFYETSYDDKVNVYINPSEVSESKAIPVYGVECGGKVYLELNAGRTYIWRVFILLGVFVVLTATIKGIQLHKVNGSLKVWDTRKYIMALYDKLGNLILVPCSTTSYLYPNVEMMDFYYEITRGSEEQLEEDLEQTFAMSYERIATPSKLEAQLKQEFGVRTLKEFLQYNKLLYIVKDEEDGYYLRKMKSVLPAPEQNVYEIVTEGRHLSKDDSLENLVEAIREETVWPEEESK